MIPYARQKITQSDLETVNRVLLSDYLTQGPEVPFFEEALIQRFGVKYAVACSSGTAALHLAYASLGIGPESCGIVPAVTFAATANAFRYLGAKILFCDVHPETGLICLDSLEEILESDLYDSETSLNGLCAVSLNGRVAPMESCRRIADHHGLALVEDASHSPGACERKPNGFIEKSASCQSSTAACLSFHPVKHVCCGEGGAVLTNSSEVAEKCRSMRSHCIERPFSHDHPTPWYYQQTGLGWNYRMSEAEAALGRSQLSRLDDDLSKRRKLAARYHEALSQPPFVEHLVPPVSSPGHAWHLYPVRFHETKTRNEAYLSLRSRDIHSQVHYLPLYRHPYYEQLYGKRRLPGAEAYYRSVLSIPLYPSLEEKEQNFVIDSLGDFLRTK